MRIWSDRRRAGAGGRQLMGWGTQADGSIVLAFHQGGADGVVRAESRELTLRQDRQAFPQQRVAREASRTGKLRLRCQCTTGGMAR